jgi:hypothetical protein
MTPELKMELAETFTNVSRAFKRLSGRLEEVRQIIIRSGQADADQMTKLRVIQQEIEKSRVEVERMLP